MPIITQRQSIAPRPGPWTDTLSFNQTDPALGIQSIGVTLTGMIDSSFAVESGDVSATTFSTTALGTVTLDDLSSQPLLTSHPSVTSVVQLAAFDGVYDNAGASGRTVLDAMGSDQVSITSGGNGAGPSLAALIGTGIVTFPVTASARISASGAGNLQAVFRTTLAASAVTAVQTSNSNPGLSGGTTTVYPPLFPPLLPSNSVSTPQQVQIVRDQTTGSVTPLSFAGFDPALGILERVNIDVTADSVGGIGAENLDPVSGMVHVTQTATAILSGAAATALDTVQVQSGLPQQTLAAYDGVLDYAGASSVNVAGIRSTASATANGIFTPTALAPFIGTGAIALSLATSGQTSIDGPGNLAVTTTLVAGAVVTLSYTYLPFPVPGLVGAGSVHTLTEDDLAQTVAAGGTLLVPLDLFGTAVTVRPGGVEHVLAGYSGGKQTVGQAASPGATPVTQPDASLIVDKTATATNSLILAHGVETVDGQAGSSTVDGGLMVIDAAGYGVNNHVISGRLLVHGGSSNTTTVEASGVVTVDNGGFLTLTTLRGTADVVSGRALGTTLVGGGTLTVEQGAAATGVTFAGGTLVVRAGASITGLQSFAAGSSIDLRDVAFGTATNGTLDSTGLHVTANGHTTDLGFTGPFGFDAATVRLSADAAGTGTLVTVGPNGLASTQGQAGSTTSDYVGPVAGIEHQFVAISPATVVASASTDNWFLHGGAADDALAVHGGRNVLDGGGGSNFLTGGTGQDSFFVTASTTTTWSTIVGAHAGDDVTLWGVDPALTLEDNQGAAGYTGLTLTSAKAGVLTKVTLAGSTTADLASGRITLASGVDSNSHLTYEYLAFH